MLLELIVLYIVVASYPGLLISAFITCSTNTVKLITCSDLYLDIGLCGGMIPEKSATK